MSQSVRGLLQIRTIKECERHKSIPQLVEGNVGERRPFIGLCRSCNYALESLGYPLVVQPSPYLLRTPNLIFRKPFTLD